MVNTQLQREEAIQLITPVIDGEVTAERSRAFFRYIQQDHEIKRRYEEEKLIKYLIRVQLPRFEAPPHLRKRIEYVLEKAQSQPDAYNSIL